MGLAANSYGDVDEVAALTPRFANTDKKFDETTRPTIDEVESWCDQISALLNSMLSEAGFGIPVTQADVKLILDFFVNQEVAAIVEGVNGGGRFGPTSKEIGKRGRFAILVEDAENFIAGHIKGFQEMGAIISSDIADNILTRSVDEKGDDTFPIRQRKEFGGDNYIDWDS